MKKSTLIFTLNNGGTSMITLDKEEADKLFEQFKRVDFDKGVYSSFNTILPLKNVLYIEKQDEVEDGNN